MSRKRMDSERNSITHKFNIGGLKGYIIAGMYPDGTLGEIFLSDIGKEGSTLQGIVDAWAISVSIGLQHGISLEDFAKKFIDMKFAPEGKTDNLEISYANSIIDYIMKWLMIKFGDKQNAFV